jgi:myo-inositol-1(or 4)-monophosphatase
MRLFERTNCVTTGSDQVARRYEFAIDLGRRAGDLGMTFFRSAETLKVESKGHQDLVSNGDREVELFVRAAISEAFPQDGIVGEEHAPKEGRSGFVWVIDPIDGTANFVRGIPAWCVAIACVHDKRTVVGVIHEPSANECFSARRGGGAFLNGRPITVSKSTSLADGSVGTGFSNRREARRIVPVIEALLAEGGVFFRNASGALMLAYVAAGRLIGYCEEHMNAWDCLAGLLMVEEAGGRILPPDGSTMVEQGTMVLAAAPGVYDRLAEITAKGFSR